MYSSHREVLGVPRQRIIPYHRKLLAYISDLAFNRRRNKSQYRSSSHLLPYLFRRLATFRNVLILIWICALYWGERKVFRDAIEHCQWDEWEDWPSHARPHRMALIADPQLVDSHTYPRRGIALAATMFYTDLYMRKSYSLLNSILLPETIVFLGDLFDGGREWNPHKLKEGYSSKDEEWKGHLEDPRAQRDWKSHGELYWQKEFVRFNSIFPPVPGRRVIRSLPGNHDLGIGNGIDEAVLNRFKVFFGDTNSVHQFGNHTFVLIDSVSLSNTENPKIFGPAKQFLEEFPETISDPNWRPAWGHPLIQDADQIPPPPVQTNPQGAGRMVSLPRILLTHVPLYRPPNTPCGPLRESSQNSISIHSGFQYQNVLLADLSAHILLQVKPVLVFSGDDHDYCEVTHVGATSGGGGMGMVREITVKSFSWAMGVRKPGFLLLSLWNPVKPGDGDGNDDGYAGKGPTVKVKLCLLPDQLGVFQFYAFVSMLMKAAISCRAIWRWWIKRKNKQDDGSDGGRDGRGASPLLPITTASEYAVSSCSFNSTSGISTRNGSSCPKNSLPFGYGVPIKKYPDNGEDKYKSKLHSPSSSSSSPTNTSVLGLGITNLSTMAEKTRLSTLTHHPIMQDGLRLVKGEMLKYKGRRRLAPLLKEGMIFGVCVGVWYLWLLWEYA